MTTNQWTVSRLIRRLTHKVWNRQISMVLTCAYGAGVINSEALHILASAFDPTQEHLINKESQDVYNAIRKRKEASRNEQ